MSRSRGEVALSNFDGAKDGAISIEEPSHTFNEYFNEGFFSKCDMVNYDESVDDVAEKINNSNYPGFFIGKARKK